MNLVSELIFPTIYTTLGALIGGWIAYRIAKRNFSMNRWDEGKTYVSLLNIYANTIVERCEDLRAFLSSWNPRNETLVEIHTFRRDCRLLENEMCFFVEYWSKYKENVQYCRLESVCRNTKLREQYKNIVSKCESIIVTISIISTYLDDVREEYDKMNNDDNERIKFLSDNKGYLIPILDQLKNKCNELNTLVSSRGIQCS